MNPKRGQTMSGARVGTNQASANAPATARQANMARPAGILMGCG